MSTAWVAERWEDYFAPLEPRQRQQALKLPAQLTFSRGTVQATVAGKGTGMATATFRVKPLSDREWRRALEAVAADSAAAHGLLSGEPGPELTDCLDAAGVALFPPPAGARPVRCTCGEPDCRHVMALIAHGTQLFAGSPFLWLEVLGRSRTELLASLRTRLADATEAGPATAAARPQAEHYWETPVDAASVRVAPEEATAPDALVRMLGPVELPGPLQQVEVVEERLGAHGKRLPTKVLQPLDEVLAACARQIGATARALALGERGGAPAVAGPLPGKPIHLADRLRPEVTEAVRREGGPLGLADLRSLCPTAVALPDEAGALKALAESLSGLPDDLVVLAERYAATRHAILDGAVFCHVVTFAEARTGRLSRHADWAWALTATDVDLTDLRPQVGDELWLRVTDPSPDSPKVHISLKPRAARNHARRHQHSVAAARALLRYMAETGRDRLTAPAAVTVLLAEGHYREGRCPDPVWLLPLHGQGLYQDADGTGGVSRFARPWTPPVERPRLPAWDGDEAALARFAADLSATDETMQAVRAWCRYWGGPQESPDRLPSPRSLQAFLWVVAPQNGGRHLAAWFEWLDPVRCAEHIAACRVDPEGITQFDQPAEGWRWIGP